jgi:hypothetical protein
MLPQPAVAVRETGGRVIEGGRDIITATVARMELACETVAQGR